jgi:hypothetical protein
MAECFAVLSGLVPYVLLAVVVWIVWVGRSEAHEWLSKSGDTKEAGIAWAAVTAVEQLFFSQDGTFKKAAALEFFKKYFPNIEEEKANMWIESAVNMMNSQRKPQ